ncbi:hypothetical protein RhiirC2_707302 [Rhizophagus irregularis]|uniref:Uncharacterized protein n=1 Tax=Rhizophagus irregularis TaxID=588596 RepID=A0A2N1NRK7_9GLOM|nr:hypothetical protein RhiirC2_707302 [Rhizophagus irregularis]
MVLIQTIRVGDNADDVDKLRCGLLFQGKDSIADYYSKVKRCNDIVNLCKRHLESEFFDGPTPENKRHIARSGFYHVHDLDKTVEMLIQAEKENVPDFITAFNDFLRQAGGAQNIIISAFLSRELTQPFMY